MQPPIPSGLNPGAAGQQRGFLEECWELAAPKATGQRGCSWGSSLDDRAAAPPAAPPAPEQPQSLRGSKSSANLAPTPLLPRDPEGPAGGGVSRSERTLPPCRWCHQSRWWSIDPRAELLTCAGCHPPTPHLKVIWHTESLSDPALEPTGGAS